MNWLYYCVLLFVVVCAVVILLSFVTKASSEDNIRGLTVRSLGKDTWTDVRQGLDKWDYIHTAAILGITAFIYYRFW